MTFSNARPRRFARRISRAPRPRHRRRHGTGAQLDSLVPRLARSKRPAWGPRASHQAALRIVKEPDCHPDSTRQVVEMSTGLVEYFVRTVRIRAAERAIVRRGLGIGSRLSLRERAGPKRLQSVFDVRRSSPVVAPTGTGPVESLLAFLVLGVACQSWLPPGQARWRAFWPFGARGSLPVVAPTGASPVESDLVFWCSG
jgi:hypothetical protein